MELTRKELYDLVWSKPITTLSKRLGLSDIGLRKQCKVMNIPTPTMGYWSKIKAGYKPAIPTLLNIDKNVEKSTNLEEVDSNEEKKVELIPPSNRFKVRELEIASGDISSYIVPEVLYAKDPLIIDTKEKRRQQSENIHLNKNPYKSEIKQTLNLYVSEKSLKRALLIYATIIKTLRLRGHDLKIENDKTYACINGEKIQVNIDERRKQEQNTENKYGFRETYFCGELSFNIYYNYRDKTIFHDTKYTKIEDKIIAIIASLEVRSEIIKEERIEAERQAKIRVEEERIRQEFKTKQNQELKEFKSMFSMAERLHKTNILRQYISTYEHFILDQGEMNEEISERLKWAKEKADWLDPFVSKADKYLDEFRKDEILKPDCPKSNAWNYSDYSSYYSSSNNSFWSNPFRKRE